MISVALAISDTILTFFPLCKGYRFWLAAVSRGLAPRTVAKRRAPRFDNELTPGMVLVVDLAQAVLQDVGINLCGRDVGVAQQEL